MGLKNLYSALNLKQFFFASFCFLVLQGCLPLLNDNSNSKNSPLEAKLLSGKIIGGEETKTGEWDNVVALVQNESPFCTGTLIHPQVVLTAAHCVDIPLAETSSYIEEVKIYVGPGRTNKKVKAQHEIVQAKIHPLYNKYALGNFDVAYLLLKKPITQIKIMPLLIDPLEMKKNLIVGQDTLLLGYGLRSNDDSTISGQKYKVQSKIFSGNTHEIHLGVPGKAPCSGDSGGPALVKVAGEWKQFAILSRGTPECGVMDAGDIYGLVHDSICWMEKDSQLKIQGELNCEEPQEIVAEEVTRREGLHFLDVCAEKAGKDSYGWKSLTHHLKIEDAGDAHKTCLNIKKQMEKQMEKQKDFSMDQYLLKHVNFLYGFNHWEKISLRENRLTSLKVFMDMKNLKELDVSWNHIDDKEFLLLKEKLPQLKIRGRRLQYHNYQKTQFLAMCLALKQGSLYKGFDGEMHEVSEEQKKTIKKIMLTLSEEQATCEGTNLELVKAVELNLAGKEVQDVTPLWGLENIEKLHLEGNEIEDFPISWIHSLSALKELNLKWNPLSSTVKVYALIQEKFPQVIDQNYPYQDHFLFRVCEGSDYTAEEEELYDRLAEQVMELKHSVLFSCKYLTFKSLQMKEMDLSGMELRSASWLKDFIQLEKLNLSHNHLTSVEGLTYLQNLKYLDLSYNKIAEIKHLSSLLNLEILKLRSNLLTRRSCPLQKGRCEF